MDQYRYTRSNSTQSLQSVNKQASGRQSDTVDEKEWTEDTRGSYNMSYSKYALHPGASISGFSPPNKRLKNSKLEAQMYVPGQRLDTVEPNISYTRSYSNPSLSNIQGSSKSSVNLQRTHSNNESDEDERFLRLAREALVATATAAKNTSNSFEVDPTILDLLTRLQYVLSPHGNPIRRSEKIRTNENGQLMIQDFYHDFPNLSNDIFTENKFGENPDHHHHHNGNTEDSDANEDWNFLIGQSSHLELKEQRLGASHASALSLKDTNQQPVLSDNSQLDKSGNDDDRKFLCSKCSMSFRRSSDLKRHEKQHLSVPPNICHLCGKGFARKDALKRHLGTLTCKRNADRKLYVENLNYLLQNPDDDTNNLRSNYNSGSEWWPPFRRLNLRILLHWSQSLCVANTLIEPTTLVVEPAIVQFSCPCRQTLS